MERIDVVQSRAASSSAANDAGCVLDRKRPRYTEDEDPGGLSLCVMIADAGWDRLPKGCARDDIANSAQEKVNALRSVLPVAAARNVAGGTVGGELHLYEQWDCRYRGGWPGEE